MDWHSRRISATLENALLEDKATSDATSRACIDPRQRATATILAKQDCVLAGIGTISRILEIYHKLDPNVIGRPDVISHGEIFDGVRVHPIVNYTFGRHQFGAIFERGRHPGASYSISF